MRRLPFAAGLCFATMAGVGCSHKCGEKISYRNGCATRCAHVATHNYDQCDRVVTRYESDPVVVNNNPPGDIRFETRTVATPGYQSGRNMSYRADQRATDYQLAASRPENDATFVREAAMGNLTEIELAKVALQNATMPEVRRFAQHVIDDHRQAQSQLEGIARRMNLYSPTDLDSFHSQQVQRLSAATSSDFDRQFIDIMIRDHREAIAKFEARAAAPPANETQQFANNLLPKLRHHLQLATDIQGRLNR